MPDQDIVERRMNQPWKRAYRLVRGGATTQEVVHELQAALAATLREDGIPGLAQLWEAASAPFVAPAAPRTLASVSLVMERGFGHSGPAKRAARAFQRHLARVDAGEALPSPGGIAEDYCREILENQFFGRVRPELLRERFGTLRDFEVWKGECLAQLEPSIEGCARQLMRKRTAAIVRAPRRRGPKRASTASLLDEPLVRVDS